MITNCQKCGYPLTGRQCDNGCVEPLVAYTPGYARELALRAARRFREARSASEQATDRAFHYGDSVTIRLETTVIQAKVHRRQEGDPSRVGCMLDHGDIRWFDVEQLTRK